MKEKILITGGSSFLATNWVHSDINKSNIVLGLNKTKISFPNTRSIYLKYNNYDELLNQIKEIKPTYIVHTAGITSVDECEKLQKDCYGINVSLAQKLATISKFLEIKFTHISTDHLYDGKKSFYDEKENTFPLNWYGRSKAEAEKKILKENKNSLIIRTNFYGWGNYNKVSISDWVINSLEKQNSINAFNDVHFTPIIIDELINCIYRLWHLNSTGIYNIVTNERISKFKFSCEIAKIFKFNMNLIKESSISDSGLLANRPKDMSLSNKKLVKKINYEPLSINLSLKKLHGQYLSRRKDLILKGFIK